MTDPLVQPDSTPAFHAGDAGSSPAGVTNPWKEYDRDRQRIVSMLMLVAQLNGRVRVRPGRIGRAQQVARRGTAAMAASKQTNDALWVPTNRSKPPSARGLLVHQPDAQGKSPTQLTTDEVAALGESGGYFARRAWNISLCGRTAVGVGVHPQVEKGERVFHAACQDRVCPICSARSNAHGAAAIGRLLRQQLDTPGQRVFFFTVTIQHELQHTFQQTAKLMRKAWARFIRRKFVKDTWGERLRCMEVEYTTDAGWHLHFHGLCVLQPGVSLDAIEIEKGMRRQWEEITARLGRRSYQLDFRELRVQDRNPETNEIATVSYWLRPDQHRKALWAEKQGKWTLQRKGLQLYRVQPLASIVNELTKYVTKRHADGGKANQVPLFEWTPQMFHEYLDGVKGWNLRRASSGWAEVLQDFEEQEILRREQDDARGQGYDYYPWAEIVESCKLAARHELKPAEADEFAAIYPRILKALQEAGCDVSADQIRGYVFRFFGDQDADLVKLRASPWQTRERAEEKHAERMGGAELGSLRARHFRVLLRLQHRHNGGRRLKQLPRLGMSRARFASVLEDLQLAKMATVAQDDHGYETLQLTGIGVATLNAMSSRKAAKDLPKPEARKQRALWRATQEGG